MKIVLKRNSHFAIALAFLVLICGVPFAEANGDNSSVAPEITSGLSAPIMVSATPVETSAVPTVTSVTEAKDIPATATKSLISNGSYWITIDPIGDKYVGEKITIFALTNLPVGKEVIVDSGLPTPQLCPEAGCPESNKENKILVKPGNNSSNETIFTLDTTGFGPNEYFFRERSLDQKTQAIINFNLLAQENLTQITPLHTPKSPLSIIGLCMALIGVILGVLFLNTFKMGD